MVSTYSSDLFRWVPSKILALDVHAQTVPKTPRPPLQCSFAGGFQGRMGKGKGGLLP